MKMKLHRHNTMVIDWQPKAICENDWGTFPAAICTIGSVSRASKRESTDLQKFMRIICNEWCDRREAQPHIHSCIVFLTE